MRIFIAEDAPLVRDRLVQLIEEKEGMTVIGQTGNASEVIPGIVAGHPEVALLDIHLQGGNTFDLLPALRQQAPATRIVLFTAALYPGYQSKARELGAETLLDKSLLGEQLQPLLQAMAGERA